MQKIIIGKYFQFFLTLIPGSNEQSIAVLKRTADDGHTEKTKQNLGEEKHLPARALVLNVTKET